MSEAFLPELQSLCLGMMRIVSEGMGPVPWARDETEAFDFIWDQHLAERARVSAFFRAWLRDGGEMDLSPATKRQIYLRLAAAMAEVAARRASPAPGNPPERAAAWLLRFCGEEWADPQAAEWLRRAARIQIERQ